VIGAGGIDVFLGLGVGKGEPRRCTAAVSG
jgi:hypothetical protein